MKRKVKINNPTKKKKKATIKKRSPALSIANKKFIKKFFTAIVKQNSKKLEISFTQIDINQIKNILKKV